MGKSKGWRSAIGTRIWREEQALKACFKIRQFPFPGPDLHSDTNLIITTEVKELRACAEAKGKL
jgi:hypothetical protein